MGEIVTYEEQKNSGLIRDNSSIYGKNFVSAEPIRYQNIVDPYTKDIPQPIQMIDKHTSDPIMRSKALVYKTHAITIFMSVMTGASMVALEWYPSKYTLIIFMVWIGIASLEWVVIFIAMSILDYKETPSSISWFQMKKYLYMMQDEHQHRLRALYPNQYDGKGKRKW